MIQERQLHGHIPFFILRYQDWTNVLEKVGEFKEEWENEREAENNDGDFELRQDQIDDCLDAKQTFCTCPAGMTLMKNCQHGTKLEACLSRRKLDPSYQYPLHRFSKLKAGNKT